MVLVRNQQPRPDCGYCSKPGQVAYYPNYDPLNFYCNDCIKLKRPSYGRQSSENSCPLADSNGEAEAADSHDDGDEDDDEYLMREDSDERAHNKAVPLGNTPARGEGSAQPFML